MRSFVAVLVAAGGWYFGTAAGSAGWALWFTPVPLLVVALGSKSLPKIFILGLTAYALGGVDQFRVYREVMPLPVLAGIVIGPAILWAVSVTIWRWSTDRIPASGAALVLPAAWTSLELVNSWLSPHGTAGSLAYSQASTPVLTQITSVTGWPGLVFLVVWVPSALAVAWSRRTLGVALGPALVGAATLAFGAARLGAPALGAPITVGVVAVDDAPGFRAAKPVDVATTTAAYARRIAALAARGADVIVAPEEVVTVSAESEAAVETAFREVAAAHSVSLVVGIDNRSDDPRLNEARWFDAEGRSIGTYHKHHLVPGFEADVRPGRSLLYRADQGVAICKDLDFPALSRAYARAGVQILYVPAWDFKLDGPLHAKMAHLRGVESGFTIVRAARNGRLTVSDARGRVRLDVPSVEGEGLVTVTPGDGPTIYARFGDLFGLAVIVSALGLVVMAAIRGRRRKLFEQNEGQRLHDAATERKESLEKNRAVRAQTLAGHAPAGSRASGESR